MAVAEDAIKSTCEIIYEEVKNLIEGFHRFYIALYDSSSSKMSFPLVMEGDERLVYEPRNFLINSLPDVSITNRKTIITNHSLLTGKEGAKDYEYWPENENLPVSMICSPMLTGDKVVGALVVEKRFGQEELIERSARLLDEIAQLAAVSIDRVYLYEGLEDKVHDRTRRLQAVHDIGVKLTEGIQLGEEEILKLIKDHAGKVMDTNNMYIALYEPDPSMEDVFDPEKPENNRINGTVRYGLMYVDGQPKEMPARKAEPGNYGRTEVIIATRESILHKTRQESEEWHQVPSHTNFLFGEGVEKKSVFASWLGVPMLVGGKVIGVIGTYDENEEYRFNRNDQKVLEMMASPAATAIENAWLYQNLEDKVKAQETVHDIGVKLTEGIQLGEEKILELIKEHADRVMDTNNMYIALYEPEPSMPDVFDPDQLENCRVHGRVRFGLMYVDGKPKEMPARKAEPGKYGRTEVILATRKPILNRTIEESEAWYELPGHENFLPGEGSKKKESFAGWLGVPMIVGGKPIGVIATYHREKEYVYDENDQKVLTMMARQAAAATEHSRLYKKIEERNKDLLEAQHKIAENERTFVLSSISQDIIHKINNLAGTVPSWVSLVRREYETPQPRTFKIHKYLDNIDESTRIILKEAHSFKKPIKESKIKINIEDLIGSIISQIELLTSVKITFECQSALPYIIATKQLLSSAIYGLIQNSVRAVSEEGHIDIRIETLIDNQDFISIEIADDGCGIDPKLFEKIFEYGTTYWKKYNGTGYGLWRARNIIQELGGKIWLKSSRLNNGSVFSVWLPIAVESH